MASSWITPRKTKAGGRRYRVEYRLGGRESQTRYGGSFERKEDALKRKRWLDGEFAASRVPDIHALAREQQTAPTVAEVAKRWQASRVDITENTRLQHRSAIQAAVRELGPRRVDTITPADVAGLVAALGDNGRKRETIRKTLQALAMVFDFAGVTPNPARDKVRVRLPHADTQEVNPPSAEHVLAVYEVLPTRYQLPLVVLDATGMRLGELEQLRWGDVDEQHGRWRVTSAASKTKQPRWVNVPPAVFDAVCALVAREDRTAERHVFQGFGGDRFRTAIARACTEAGVPAFSPHGLRHRRISLLHSQGVPWARIGEHVGQRSLRATADTYTHVLMDEAELDYPAMLA